MKPGQKRRQELSKEGFFSYKWLLLAKSEDALPVVLHADAPDDRAEADPISAGDNTLSANLLINHEITTKFGKIDNFD